MAANQQLKKQDVVEVAEEFFGLVNARNLETTIKPLRTQFEEYKAGQFRLVVVGEIKKGKSSFVNALIGEPELLPVDVPVTTSTVYRLMYGDTEKYQVFFNPRPGDETQREPIYITREELIDYGTEDGNPNNEKEVDYIAIELPNPLLQSGVIITDTPGLGGLFAEHGDITLKNAPTADAVCFVVDSVEAVVSQEEVEHLKKFVELPTQLQGTPPSIFFVQTKTDAVPEEHWQQYRERNLEIISENLAIEKEKLHYFPVSANLKHTADQESDPVLLQESGFPQLLGFFSTTLLREKEERLARKLLSPIRETAEEKLLPDLDNQKNVFATESKAELDRLLQESQESQKRFADWTQNEMPKSIGIFENSAADVKRASINRIQNELSASEGDDSPIVRSIVDPLREKDLSAKELRDKFHAIRNACHAECQKVYADILEEYQEEIGGLMAQVADEFGSSLKSTFTSDTPGTPGIPEGVIRSITSRFATIREVGLSPLSIFILGSVAGTILTKAGLLAAIGSVFPPVTVPFAIAIAVGAFVYYTWRDNRDRAQQSAITEIEKNLRNVVSEVHRYALQSFTEVSVELERGFKALVTDIVDEIKSEQARKQAEIQESRKQTTEAKSQKLREVEETISQAKALISRISGMLGSEA